MGSVKYTKKATFKIYSFVSKFFPGISKNISLNEAWEMIADSHGMEGSIVMSKGTVSFELFKDDLKVHTFEWEASEAYDQKQADFEWDLIYRTVLEYIIKYRLTSKLSKAVKQAKSAARKEEAAKRKANKSVKSTAKKEVPEVKPVNPEPVKQKKKYQSKKVSARSLAKKLANC